MKPAEIVQLGAAILRETAVPVVDFESAQLWQQVEQMLAILTSAKGVGLAAPQLGYSICVIIVASKPSSRYPNAPLMSPVVMINPVFTPVSNQVEKDWEGCLSIPGVRALVPRYKEIAVQYANREGKLQTLQLEGFVARIFQHEYDHLQGMVYLDRVENNRDIISETEFFKLIAV